MRSALFPGLVDGIKAVREDTSYGSFRARRSARAAAILFSSLGVALQVSPRAERLWTMCSGRESADQQVDHGRVDPSYAALDAGLSTYGATVGTR